MQSVFYFLGVFIASVFVLYTAQSVFIPLVIAIFVWYLIQSLKEGYQNILKLPVAIATIASVISIAVAIWFPIQLIKDLVPLVMKAAPSYQENLFSIWSSLKSQYGFLQQVSLEKLQSNINIEQYFAAMGASIAQIASKSFLITIYVVFLLLEQGSFANKFQMIFAKNGREDHIQSILKSAFAKIKRYIWMKSLLNAITAFLCYMVMLYVQLDYAAFWAMLIFLFNFIPSIGAVLSTILPSLLAIIQFQFTWPVFFVAFGVSFIQIIIGNGIEPRIMGNSLNLSPFVIILSLILWGSIWGIVGAFLAVPLMVVVMILLSQFKDTQSIAILMSKDGNI